MAKITFKNFFSEHFIADRAYTTFKPFHFKEMAMRHDISKTPVNFDKDDIEFLSQFPHAFWPKAQQQRYDMLFDAIEKLHHERRSKGHDDLKSAVKNAMTTQNWSSLRGKLPDDQIARLSRHLRAGIVGEMSPGQIDIEADKIAHEHIKSGTDRVEDPGEVEFTFQNNDFNPENGPHGKDTSSERTKDRVTYMAKPYLNRLYHKLERTEGLPHLPDSGLEGSGKYGYDMAEPLRSSEPEELPHSTSGMKFPTPEQTRNRLRDFMNLNQHRIFGDLPKDAKWLPTKYTDTWSINYVKDEIRKQIEAQLRVSGQYKSNQDLEKDALKMANKRVLELGRAGQLKGPPIPGKFPEGIPIEVKGSEGNEKLVPPPLYLPHQLKDMKIKQPDGTIKTVKREVPIVSPAHFFRALGSEDSDYKHEMDADGNPQKVFDDQGRPVWNVPKDKLRGHEGQFVHVGDDEYVPTKHRAAGALDFNKNSEGRRHVTRGDEGYDEAFEKVFGSQRKVLLNGKKLVPTSGAGFYEDIMRGILLCYTSQACGGSTGHERAILLQNIEDVHQIIVQTMLMDLRNEKLYDETGRQNYSKGKAVNYIQKDQGQGGGTRRLRKLTQDARNVDLDFTATNGEGGKTGIADNLATQAQGATRLTGKRGKGGRRLDTSGHNNAYSLDNFRTAIRQLSSLARVADNTSTHAKAMSRSHTGQEIIAMLKSGIDDRAAVIEQITGLLSALYQQSGNDEDEAKKMANGQIKSWVEDGNNTSEKLVATFQNHPLVQQAMESAGGEADKQGVQPGQKEAPMSAEEQQAVDQFHHDLRGMRERGGELDDDRIKGLLLPKAGQKYGIYVTTKGNNFAEFDREKVMNRVQNEINRLYGRGDVGGDAAPEQMKMAARDVAKPTADVDKGQQADRMKAILAAKRAGAPASTGAPASNPAASNPAASAGGSWHDLWQQKKYADVAVHPKFLKDAHPNQLKMMQDWLNRNQGTITPEQYAAANTAVTNAINSRGTA